MNGLQRTLDFIKGRPVDRPPFHPIIMRFAARYAGIPYGRFCLDYRAKCAAMVTCARDFAIDWVTVMSDPYAEAEAFGMDIEYPADNLPIPGQPLIQGPTDIGRLAVPEFRQSPRLQNRINEITHYHQHLGDRYFIVGWVEGPLACYANLRGFETACLDLLEHPQAVAQALSVIQQAAADFIDRQIAAGAHCIGIGDAVCSQIGPELYHRFGFPGEQALVDLIHTRGALAKLHICGDTTAIMPQMINTGADIIDVDHGVRDMGRLAPLLENHQVFCGNSDPVSIIQNGGAKKIADSLQTAFCNAGGRCIISAGCEITPETPGPHLMEMGNTARRIGNDSLGNH